MQKNLLCHAPLNALKESNEGKSLYGPESFIPDQGIYVLLKTSEVIDSAIMALIIPLPILV